MDCAAFKELVALLALGGLEPADRAAAEAHLAEPVHDGCVEALARALEGVAALHPNEAPPARVWERIQAEVALPARRMRRARRRAAIAVAVAGFCAAAAVLVTVRSTRDGEQARQVVRTKGAELTTAVRDLDTCRDTLKRLEADQRMRAEAVALLELAGTRLYPLPAEKGKSATANAILHTGLKRAYVVADGLTPVADRDYQMWIARGKKVVPAGLLTVDSHGRSVLRIDYAALLGGGGAPDAMMITLEPRGGSDVVRGPTIVLGTIRT
jgi:hypothetical protein